MTPNIPITAWAPDADPTQPGVLVETMNVVPTRRGYAPEYALEDSVFYTGTVADEVRSADTVQLSTGNYASLVGNDDGIFNLTVGAVVDRSRSTAYNSRSTQYAYWRFAAFGSDVYAAQYDNTLQATSNINTTDFSDVSGGPKAFTMAVQNGYMIVGNIKDGSYAGGDSWLCCAEDDPTDWTPDIATGAATGVLTNTPGPILRLIPYRDYVIAFKANSFYRGTFVGRENNTWEWPVVSTSIGIVGHDTVCEVDGVLYWLSENGFYRWAGGAVDRIRSAPFEWLIDNAGGYAFLQDMQVVWDPAYRVIRWIVAAPGELIGKMVLTYHPDTDRWGRSQMDVWRGVPLISESTPSVTNATPLLRSLPLGYIGSDGKVKVPSDTPGESYFTTGDIGDDDQVFDLSRMRVRYLIEPTTSTATHSTRMTLGDDLTVVATNDRVDGKYDFSTVAARWHRVKFTQTGRYEVTGFSVDMPKAGKR